MLQSVLGQYSVPKESFASVCVIVDKVFFYILNSLNLRTNISPLLRSTKVRRCLFVDFHLTLRYPTSK